MKYTVTLIAALFIAGISCAKEHDPYEIFGEENFLSGYTALNADGTVNVVVEIPSGSVDKWEVDKTSGTLKWEIRNGSYRKVNYLGYPANYGMIPQTLLPKELGGDGDPLDVIVLGEPIPRGSIVPCKIIGMLKLLDGGEQDDKLIAVVVDSPFDFLNSMEELNKHYTGITTIIETWFSNYKGKGKLKSLGFENKEAAMKVVEYSIQEYQRKTLPNP